MSQSKERYQSDLVSFGLVSGLWLGLGMIFSFAFDSGDASQAAVWMLILWLLCMLDLLALRKVIAVVLQWSDSQAENQVAYSIQTAFWGALKLVCLGLFIIVLLKGQKIPLRSLLMGIGTMTFVPLGGGFLWSQRVLNNA